MILQRQYIFLKIFLSSSSPLPSWKRGQSKWPLDSLAIPGNAQRQRKGKGTCRNGRKEGNLCVSLSNGSSHNILSVFLWVETRRIPSSSFRFGHLKIDDPHWNLLCFDLTWYLFSLESKSLFDLVGMIFSFLVYSIRIQWFLPVNMTLSRFPILLHTFQRRVVLPIWGNIHREEAEVSMPNSSILQIIDISIFYNDFKLKFMNRNVLFYCQSLRAEKLKPRVLWGEGKGWRREGEVSQERTTSAAFPTYSSLHSPPLLPQVIFKVNVMALVGTDQLLSYLRILEWSDIIVERFLISLCLSAKIFLIAHNDYAFFFVPLSNVQILWVCKMKAKFSGWMLDAFWLSNPTLKHQKKAG